MTGWWHALALLAAWLVWRSLPRPIEVPPKRLSIDIDADAVNTAATLAAHLNAPRLCGTRVELLVNGDRIFPPMLEAIRAARESVHLLTFIYWTGEIATTFAEELAAAPRRGLEVRVLLDAFGAKKIDRRCLDTMRDAGCEVAWYHAPRWRSLRQLNERTHRKILVVARAAVPVADLTDRRRHHGVGSIANSASDRARASGRVQARVDVHPAPGRAGPRPHGTRQRAVWRTHVQASAYALSGACERAVRVSTCAWRRGARSCRHPRSRRSPRRAARARAREACGRPHRPRSP